MDKFKNTLIYKVIFFITLFVLVFCFSIKSNVLDYDLWARLIQGYGVINNGSVFYKDMVSYTPTHTWYDPEWLSSALFYLTAKKFGIAGLTILKALLIYLILFFISITINYKKDKSETSFNILFYVILMILMQNSSLTEHTVRCQLITFSLFAIWIFLLDKIRYGNDKLLFALPFIMLFWLNTHGGCIAGVGILFIYTIAEAINKKPFKKYLFALIFVCAVFIINPWGIDYIKFMFESSYLDRCWIAEWQSPLHIADKLYVISAAFCVFCYFFNIFIKKIKFKDIDKVKSLIIAVLIYLSFKHIKHAGLYIVGISYFMYDDFFFTYHYFMEKLRQYLQIDIVTANKLSILKYIFTHIVILGYCAITIFLNPLKESYKLRTINSLPIRAVEFMKINNIKGNIFAPFSQSGYIAYKCYPDLKIYMDGRQEQVYNTDIFDKEMFFLAKLNKDKQRFLNEFPHDIILLNQDLKVSKIIEKMPDWKLVYEDNVNKLYIKKDMLKFKYKTVKRTPSEIMDDILESSFK